eukprot:8860299-Pyramimonas_sp.AAC.1
MPPLGVAVARQPTRSAQRVFVLLLGAEPRRLGGEDRLWACSPLRGGRPWGPPPLSLVWQCRSQGGGPLPHPFW